MNTKRSMDSDVFGVSMIDRKNFLILQKVLSLSLNC